MNVIRISLLSFALFVATVALAQTVKNEPTIGEVPMGKKVLVDDGTRPAGQDQGSHWRQQGRAHRALDPVRRQSWGQEIARRRVLTQVNPSTSRLGRGQFSCAGRTDWNVG